MTFSMNMPFTIRENYEFDSTKIVFTAGVARLIATTGIPQADFHSTLDENSGMSAIDHSGNERNGAFQGGLDESAWVTGKINYAVQFDGAGIVNFGDYFSYERTTAFSLECWIKFTSTASQIIMGRQKNSGNFQGYQLSAAAGKLRIALRDDLNNKITKETTVLYNDGDWHHVVGTYDGSSGSGGVTLYVDNIDTGAFILSDTFTSSFLNTADFQISGRDGSNNPLASGTCIDECAVYQRELTPAEVDFRWNDGNGTVELPGATTTYPVDNPYLVNKGPVYIQDLSDLQEVVTETGSDEVRYSIVLNAIDYWWTGLAWAVSTGYDETNTVAEILANASTLPLPELFQIKSYLHSDDGTSTPEISNLYIEYNPDQASLSEPNECSVYGYINDAEAENVEGVTVIATLLYYNTYGSSYQMTKQKVVAVSDSTGRWDMSLVENENMEGTAGYKFEFKGAGIDHSSNRIVPNQLTKNFAELETI
jgi:hypothetical protein